MRPLPPKRKEAALAVETRATYQTRLLPFDEWDRLRDFPIATNGLPDPTLCSILVTETDGVIVGVWAVLTAVMQEGLWIHPDHRGHTPIAWQLLKGMKQVLQDLGVVTSFTIVQDAEVMVLAHKAGYVRCPGDLWMLVTPAAEEA